MDIFLNFIRVSTQIEKTCLGIQAVKKMEKNYRSDEKNLASLSENVDLEKRFFGDIIQTTKTSQIN